MDKRTLTILGATGSVGRQACDVAAECELDVKMLSGGKNATAMAEEARRLHPQVCIMDDASAAAELRLALAGEDVRVYSGEESLLSYLEEQVSDLTVHSIAGLAGTASALAAAKTGTRIAMANKEAVIACGELIRDALRLSGGEMIPVDSEHSAIFQCLTTEGAPVLFERCPAVERVILTASGGPFFGMKREELQRITPEEALAHPTWRMGPKITIDCATLMNKGFEVIEAARFFGLGADEISVVIHRQSIIHSMVEYIDNAVIAQLGAPDMRSAVRYALNYPERCRAFGERLDFAKLQSLTFHEPDTETFPLLSAARNALERGGLAPAALIAADEVAVDAFIRGRISFAGIADTVLEVMETVDASASVTEQSLAASDELVRARARDIISRSAK